jgi:hypothetical protein
MKTKLIKTTEYDGLGFRTTPIPEAEQYEVEIMGVMMPCDPGIVRVKNDNFGKVLDVPTFALAEYPNIDFEALLSDKQLESRKECGILFGNGVSDEKRYFKPLSELPLKQDTPQAKK